MNRPLATAILTAALVAPLTATSPATAAPGGMCSPRTAPQLVASGSWTASGITLAGTRIRPRLGRDRWTDITVANRTYDDVGPAVHISRRLPAGTTATARFRGAGGLKDYTCTFRLARAS